MRSPTVSTQLQEIAQQARQHPKKIFTTLAHLMDVDFLREAYRRLNKKGAPGLNKVTAADYAEHLDNARFLIMPWVQVANLASHSLSCVVRRVSQDWQDKYAHPIYMLETFVDRSRYRGTCYQAANWVCTGQTTGRTRNDRYQRIHTSRKDLYVYPLVRQYRNRLCHEA